MELRLTRYCYAPDHTLGYLDGPGIPLIWTVEAPWKPSLKKVLSQPFKSCIPDGFYHLLPHRGQRWQKTWAMANRDLRVVPQLPENDNQYRYACVIHPAEFPTQIQGCIGIGLRRLFKEHPRIGTCMPALFDGPAAMRQLQEYMDPDKAHTLVIRPHEGARVFE